MATKIMKKVGMFAIGLFFVIMLIPTVSAINCTTVADCPGEGEPWPIDVAQYVTYSCQGGFCIVSDPIQVECLSDNACQQGYECNLNTYKCVVKEAAALPECECESCPQCPDTTDYTIPMIIVGALIALAIVFSTIQKRKKR